MTTVNAVGNSLSGLTGSGTFVGDNSPILVTPNLGIPSAITLTNGIGLPISTGVSGLGSGIATALSSSLNGTGALAATTSPTFVTPVLGTPTSITLTNGTGLPVSTGISGFGTNVATGLATNLNGTGALIGTTSASLVTPASLGVQQQALNMNSNLINNLTDPVSEQDAATRNYIDQKFPITFANGGTGAALTASNGGILWSNASTAAILSGTATAGLALLSGATAAPTWSTAPPITKVIIRTFGNGSSTYTPTTGMVYCTVQIVAGGGSGGGVSGGTAGLASAAAGGGGGGYAVKTYTAALIGANAAVVVGHGGAAPAAGNNNGSGGLTSSFTPSGAGAVLSCGGGALGNGMGKSNTAGNAGPGAGGTATGGDLNIAGMSGGYGMILAAGVLAISGGGGSSGLGVGGKTLVFSIQSRNGFAGTGYGAGGSGAADTAQQDRAGGAGADGICYITEYVSV